MEKDSSLLCHKSLYRATAVLIKRSGMQLASVRLTSWDNFCPIKLEKIKNETALSDTIFPEPMIGLCHSSKMYKLLGFDTDGGWR